MKCAIVNTADVDLSLCMSAKRFTGGCATCQRVTLCKLPEGLQGLISFHRERIKADQKRLDGRFEESQQEITRAKKVLAKRRKAATA